MVCIMYDKQGHVLYDPLYDVDESSLSDIDRLGLACCRLNQWEWDEYIGPKPDGFDQLPRWERHPFLMKILATISPKKYAPIRSKSDYITPVIKAIESDIGADTISRCHWVYGLKRTEEEWRKWYYSTEHVTV